MSSLCILVVSYYSVRFIRKLLTSSQLNNHELPVFIVNNTSDDKEVLDSVKTYQLSEVIEANKNLGFGGGCNVGLKWIYQQDPDASVWLINPDTVLDQDAIPYVEKCLSQYSDVAILGTRIRDSHDHPWFEIGCFNTWLGSITHLESDAEKADSSKVNRKHPTVINSRWVSGCSLIINLAQFQSCPAFDENMFLYYEDCEFCERYRRQGKLVAVTEAALVTHAVSSTTGENPSAKLVHATFSKLYLLQRHGTLLAIWLNLVYLSARSLWEQITGNPDSAIARWQGIRQFMHFRLTGRKAPIKGLIDYAD
ncbi:MAG: glycosyltransferase family 2 protein [Leptolyngbyaceae cyanobacterium SL_5_14]|nr:glycosyltransferase family 2 protein [Leptolyngbyaceae cyanobacterium SL_5_14]